MFDFPTKTFFFGVKYLRKVFHVVCILQTYLPKNLTCLKLFKKLFIKKGDCNFKLGWGKVELVGAAHTVFFLKLGGFFQELKISNFA